MLAVPRCISFFDAGTARKHGSHDASHLQETLLLMSPLRVVIEVWLFLQTAAAALRPTADVREANGAGHSQNALTPQDVVAACFSVIFVELNWLWGQGHQMYYQVEISHHSPDGIAEGSTSSVITTLNNKILFYLVISFNNHGRCLWNDAWTFQREWIMFCVLDGVSCRLCAGHLAKDDFLIRNLVQFNFFSSPTKQDAVTLHEISVYYG